MSRFQQWLETLVDDRKNATSPSMWAATGAMVVGILVLTAYVPPLASWFGMRFWPALGCFIPAFLLGIIAGHLEQRGRLSLWAFGVLVLLGNAYLQFFFAALIAFSRPPGSFVLASLFILTVAFHGYMTRATPRYPYPLVGTALAIGAAILVNPSPETLTVFGLVAPTSVTIGLLTGASGLREHRDRRERDTLRQAIYYRALNERAAETSRMSERVINLLRYNHDAGNTLSTVFLNAQLLDERLRRWEPTASSEELGRSMERLLDQLKRLKSLIVEAHRVADELPSMAEAPVLTVVEQVVEECRSLYPRVGVELDSHETTVQRVRVHDGEMGLRRIVQNLLYNACEGNGTVAAQNVRVGLTVSDRMVELSFKDDGPGFAPQYLGEVITPFLSTKPHGHGLGLYNASHLVEASGGSFIRRNGARGGAIVEVRLELTSDAPIRAKSAEESGENGPASSEPQPLCEAVGSEATQETQ